MNIHVRELLETSLFKSSQVLAGENGLERIVTSATVIDTPDAVRWLKGNELILTTAYSIKGDAAAQEKLIEDLVDCGSAALAVKLRHLGSLPDNLKKRADELSLPIISIEEKHSWLDVINYIRTLKFSKRVAEAKHTQGIYPRFFERAFEEDAYRAIVEELYRSTGYPAFIIDFFAGDFIAAPHDFALPPHTSLDNFKSIDLDYRLFGIYRVKVYRWNDGLDQYSYVSVEIGLETSAAACICLWADINDFHRNDWMCLLNAATGVAVMLIENSEETNLEAVGNSEFFKNRKDCFYAWDRAGFLILILTFEHENMRMELARQAQESLRKQTTNHPSIAGIGGVVDSISDIRVSHDQASYALKIGKQLGGSRTIYDYHDLGVYRLLQYSLSHREVDDLYETYLLPLIEYDAASGADLVSTLETFLESGLNYRATAAKLFVHHNTVRYRIQRIEELCQVNLESSEDRLNLSIALKIMPFKTDRLVERSST